MRENKLKNRTRKCISSYDSTDALIGFWNKIYGCHYPFLAIFNSCS